MHPSLRTLLGLAFLSLVCAPASHADVRLSNGTMLSDKPYFIVTYIEADPAAVTTVAGLLKQQSAASRKEPGNLRAEALQRIGQPNHFVLLEAWTDGDARKAHALAAHTVKFRELLQPHLYNPYDERPHVGLVAIDPQKVVRGTGDTVYVVTHVDIIPPEQFAPCKRQVKESGPCGNELVIGLVNAGRKHSGNLRFDALTQANRPNHMTIVEMWDSPQHQQAHETTVDVKNFRDSLSGIVPGSGVAADPLFVLNPLTGSLYDERLYKTLE